MFQLKHVLVTSDWHEAGSKLLQAVYVHLVYKGCKDGTKMDRNKKGCHVV